jgi:hypothetical protein
MAKFYGTGNVDQPERQPDFTVFLSKRRETASYWVMSFIDENNCEMLYRYDNGLWRVNKCSSLIVKDGKFYYSHRGIHINEHHPFDKEDDTKKPIFDGYTRYVEKVIESILLQS